MSIYSELEITVQSLDSLNCRVGLRFGRCDDQWGVLEQVGPADVQIDHEALAAELIEGDLLAYGRELRDALFASPEIAAKFAEAYKHTPLRIRLGLDPTGKALHGLCWELLCGPDDAVLSSKHDIAFSRYLPSGKKFKLRRETDERRALIVVADPSPEDRAKYGLSEIDVDYAHRATALKPIICDPLTSADGPATMNHLIDALKRGANEFDGYDILYLVCHGAKVRGATRLLLDLKTEQEKANPAYFRSGEILVQRLVEEVPQLPRLVLLASCATAGTGDEDTLAALGPLLAAAGVPAVIAMQGYIPIQTIDQFIPVFFEALDKHGEVDRAVRRARNEIKNRPELAGWWMPALFMRLASGRIWYKPGFDIQAGEEADLWSRVTSHIVPKRDLIKGHLRSRSTPILGPGLTQHLFGSDSSLASYWARKHYYPLAAHHQDHFPRVTQYLKVQRLGEEELIYEYLERLDDGLRSHFPSLQARSDLLIDELIEELWKSELERTADEPHNILARLPFTCYVTTSPTSVLETALRHQGREPLVELYDWREGRSQKGTQHEDVPPSEERPLVFHALGHYSEPDTLVLSEDDYFSYLINFIRYWSDDVSSSVSQALTNSSLLFLGFRMFRWDFRMIFHSLLSQGQRNVRDRYPHVAAQVSPAEEAFLNPAAACRYLAKYYGGKNLDKINLDLYWGESTDFLRNLNEEWAKHSGKEGA